MNEKEVQWDSAGVAPGSGKLFQAIEAGEDLNHCRKTVDEEGAVDPADRWGRAENRAPLHCQLPKRVKLGVRRDADSHKERQRPQSVIAALLTETNSLLDLLAQAGHSVPWNNMAVFPKNRAR